MASHPGPPPMTGMPHTSPGMEGGNWPDYQSSNYRSETPSDSRSPPVGNPGFLKGFQGVQKKMTRDGQPAKRRGPKPDSKPALTRRQELNRQAQRTHRERKEQYIKALEIELSRLRETFVSELNTANQTIESQKRLLEDQRLENHALRAILASRNIRFEKELGGRKASIALARDNNNGLSAANLSALPTFPNGMQGPPSSSGYSTAQEQLYGNGPGMSASGRSGRSPGTTQHSQSPPELPEYGIKRENAGVPSMPGIFENEPQLGIDFILQLERTCRDHGEYLVRRSVDSPDDPEEALFSGHALMATCPPPSHIDSVAAQQGGLIPTYDHKVPDAESMRTLTTLLNLSQSLKANSLIPGGQVTPIMALQSLKGHPNYTSLTREDVISMVESIRSKVRCYGFGAVMEDFELRDALSSIFAMKPEVYESMANDYSVDIDDMYS